MVHISDDILNLYCMFPRILKSCETGDPYFGNLSSVDGTYHMAVDDPGDAKTAHDLRLRAHRCALANEHLREELLRAEDSIATLERQLAVNGRKLCVNGNI